MKADDCIFFQLAKASRAGTRFWGQKVSTLNLTAVQAMVIRFLYDKDHISSSDLGKRTDLDSATLTGILDRLAAADLIERRQNKNDRRAIQILLTKKGNTVAKEVSRLMEEANVEFLKVLSDNDQLALRGLIKKIRNQPV